jgi:hypothetical protein
VTAFVDASALVKLYVPEQGSEAVGSLEEPFVVSGLSRVEVASGLWRKHREGWVAWARVFHDRVAHLMRTGNFTTPRSASRSPSFTSLGVLGQVLGLALGRRGLLVDRHHRLEGRVRSADLVDRLALDRRRHHRRRRLADRAALPADADVAHDDAVVESGRRRSRRRTAG